MTKKQRWRALWPVAAICVAITFIYPWLAWTIVALFYMFAIGLLLGGKPEPKGPENQ